MSRIKEKFNQLKLKKETALISYIMDGYTSEKANLTAVRGLIQESSDIMNIGYT